MHIEALKFSKLSNNATIFVRRDSVFFGIINLLLNFSNAFQKEPDVSFFATRIDGIVDRTFAPDSLSSNSYQT